LSFKPQTLAKKPKTLAFKPQRLGKNLNFSGVFHNDIDNVHSGHSAFYENIDAEVDDMKSKNNIQKHLFHVVVRPCTTAVVVGAKRICKLYGIE
jgi:hypothetical protein